MRDDLLRGGVKNVKNEDDSYVEVDKRMAFELSQGVYPPIFHKYRK